MTSRTDMLFIVEMSVRYHRRRASFLDITSSLMSLVTVIGGAGAFLTLIGGESTLIAKVATLTLAIAGTVQLVFRLDACAAAHRIWLKQWIDLLLVIRKTADPDQATIAAWMARRYAIEAECVTEMRALQIDCYNRTIRALDRDAPLIPMKKFHRALLQVWSFEGAYAD